MSLAIVSLIALMVAVFISCISKRNIGIMCMVFGFLIAMFSRGTLKVEELQTFFPMKLFLILFGATLLFSMANNNGTVEKVAKYAVKASRGQVGLFPIIIYLLCCVLAAVGPGNVATVVCIAPIAMALCAETRISPMMMTIMVVNGANAGALSPLAPTGIIGIGLTEKIGLPYIGGHVFLQAFIASSLVCLFAYVLFGGLRFWGSKVDPAMKERARAIVDVPVEPFDRGQLITMGAIAAWIFLVLVAGWDVGYTAMVMALVLSLLNAADEKEAMKKQPWFIMFMLAGVMVLVEVCGKVGGLDYAINAIAKVTSPFTISAVFGFLNGFVSAYSGSSAVVMPTFIPLIPGLVEKMGAIGDAALQMKMNLVYTSCVSAHLVDASPLSMGGAMCIANSPHWEDKNKLFRNLLIWGVSMSVGAAIISFILWR